MSDCRPSVARSQARLDVTRRNRRKMHERLLEVLACPHCEASLAVGSGKVESKGVIEDGRLDCPTCDRAYQVTEGVPRLLPSAPGPGTDASRTIAHFQMEFTAPGLTHDDADISPPRTWCTSSSPAPGSTPAVYERMAPGPSEAEGPAAASAYRPDSSFLVGKRVLDGGCGPGRFLPLAAEAADHVVGLEYGDHVVRAAHRCKSLDNVDLVQGSVLQPPFSPGSFDYAFTLGVLHHTPDPRLACLRLAELVKAGGAMSVWVYPPEYWGDPIRSVVNRAGPRTAVEDGAEPGPRDLHPVAVPARSGPGEGRPPALDQVLAAPLFLLGIPRHDEREVMISTTYDRFGPSIITTHDYAEVEGWLGTGGFERVRRLPIPTAVFAEKPARLDDHRLQ